MPVVAVAQATSEYEAAIERAVIAYNDGDYAEAANQFRRAHELSPNARTLRGIGMTRLELADYVGAAEALEGAIMSNVVPLEGALRNEAQRLLREALAHVGRLHLEIEPRSAEVAVDGSLKDAEPDRPIIVAPGGHLLEIRAPGYELLRKSIRAEAGRDLAIEIELNALSNSQEKHRWLRNPWLWVGASIVVGGVVVGGLALAGRFDKGSDGGNRVPMIHLLSRSPQ